ncbi:Ligand-binding SRPBCC domain-containing protein [Filimonas lacunae]|uniref:Ligand-binding SRPBCC domain-containing protein n=1 Tax=Filimonas lacunae TaxID=477680 RepID=A0A173MRJ4_9BACT|nr:SRPBCC family protein [Filimonas lacunae]BAV10001.1 cell division inhibitor [Filimonas lacunae]SIS82378.1 Ligand-binding SRPBCC domain-containing protein [Filimonas lacunae]
MSKVYSLKTVQWLPVDISTAWQFFSSAHNLVEITPPDMGFDIVSKYHGNKLYAGQIIEYKLRLLGFIRLYWMTEITHVQEGAYFIDEQRFGPYALWHHQHHFKAVNGGVEMTDIVHYKIPFGWLGSLAHALYVKKQLKHIFDYRYTRIAQLFKA